MRDSDIQAGAVRRRDASRPASVDRKSKLISGNIYAHLRQEIISGKIREGEFLRQEAIAARLNVSRMPVRDALKRLIKEGLAVEHQNGRVSVVKLSAKELTEIFEIRAVLEGLVAKVGCKNISTATLIQLEACVLEMVASTSIDQYIEANHYFHHTIAVASGMTRVVNQLVELRDIVVPYIRIFATNGPPFELEAAPHKLIIDALRRRDPDECEEISREHVLGSCQEIVESVKRLERSGGKKKR